MVTSSASSTPVQSMEIFLPSWRVNSTHPVSMLNLQALSSYFIIASSKSCYQLTVYDKVSEFYAVHGSLHCCTRRKRKIRTLLQSETGSDFSCLVGAGGFEPPKLKSSRFTVCPHWPLGNTPRFCSRPLPDDLFILSDCGRFVNYFFRIFAAFLRKLSAGSVLGQMFPALVIP